MSTYTPTRVAVGTALDELGIWLGLSRIEGESLSDYRLRLLLETREPSGPTEIEFVKSLARKVSAKDIPVFRITLVKDGDGIPLAVDPYLEITSSYLRTYSDYENDVIDVEVFFHDRDDGYFLEDVEDALVASTYFDVEVLAEDYDYWQSKKLRPGNSNVHVPSELVFASTANRLLHGNVVRLHGSASTVLVTEKDLLTDVLVSGDYFVDYINGVIFTYDVLSGFISYTYNQFPYDIYWQPIRTYPYLDADKQYFHYDTLISDTTGEPEYVNLNGDGARIANSVLSVHSMTWGE